MHSNVLRFYYAFVMYMSLCAQAGNIMLLAIERTNDLCTNAINNDLLGGMFL